MLSNLITRQITGALDQILARQQQTAVHTGIVKWFNAEKGYGFIVPDDPDLTAVYDEEHQDVFVHYSAIEGEGYRTLYENDRVKFTVSEGSQGFLAKNVRVMR